MKTLDQIAIACGADKASTHPVKGHNYAVHYDAVFGHLRGEQIKLLEIGVGGGESIRMWLEGFPHAHIYGCDIVSQTNPWNTHYPEGTPNPNPRYDFLQGDQSSKTHWACYLAFSKGDFSVIVDDGSHMAKDFQVTFEKLWPTVVPNGYYVIEDMNVGSTAGSVFLSPGFPNHIQWLASKIEELNSGTSDISTIHLSPELAIFRKRA